MRDAKLLVPFAQPFYFLSMAATSIHVPRSARRDSYFQPVLKTLERRQNEFVVLTLLKWLLLFVALSFQQFIFPDTRILCISCFSSRRIKSHAIIVEETPILKKSVPFSPVCKGVGKQNLHSLPVSNYSLSCSPSFSFSFFCLPPSSFILWMQVGRAMSLKAGPGFGWGPSSRGRATTHERGEEAAFHLDVLPPPLMSNFRI